MADDALAVWHQPTPPATRRAGLLWRDEYGRMGFRYDAEWQRDGFPLSRQLPLATATFAPADGVAHRFFANLLPEGDARTGLARSLGTSNDDFELLRRVGGECAGAFCLLLPGDRPGTRQPAYRELTDKELTVLVRQRGVRPSSSVGARTRLSLAGAQHKMPVRWRDQRYGLPLDDAPSTHILKFDLARLRNVPLFEAFTTHLAAAVGLPVVDIDWRRLQRLGYAVIVRFDRPSDANGNIRRLHQEDFCQALGYDHLRKYEADAGPSLAQCADLLREVATDPAIDIPRLLGWQAFNWLAGNSDGHAKNLALLYDNGTIRMAPFYDLICTRALRGLSRNLAMSIGGENDPGRVRAWHWRELADACGIRPRFVETLVAAMAEKLQAAVGPCRRAFEERYEPAPPLQRIEQVVVRQCRRVLSRQWRGV